MGDWYERIESEIRPIVRLLREHGINTTSSCGHELTVEFDIHTGEELDQVNNLLFDAGYYHFEIRAHWTTVPFPHRCAELRLLPEHV